MGRLKERKNHPRCVTAVGGLRCFVFPGQESAFKFEVEIEYNGDRVEEGERREGERNVRGTRSL